MGERHFYRHQDLRIAFYSILDMFSQKHLSIAVPLAASLPLLHMSLSIPPLIQFPSI